MKRFEYEFYGCSDCDITNAHLNDFGARGWELVSHCTFVTIDKDEGPIIEHSFSFKRELK